MADAAEPETQATPPPAEEPRGASVLVEGGAGVRAKPVDRMERVSDIDLNVDVEVGRAILPISNIIELAEGSIVQLDKLSGESVDICVNHEKLATGEIIVIQDKMRVRVIEIVDQEPEENGDTDADP